MSEPAPLPPPEKTEKAPKGELPYGGDFQVGIFELLIGSNMPTHFLISFCPRDYQKAMRAQDRAAIKILMARNKERNTHEGWKSTVSGAAAAPVNQEPVLNLRCGEGNAVGVAEALTALGFVDQAVHAALATQKCFADDNGDSGAGGRDSPNRPQNGGGGGGATAFIAATAKLLSEATSGGALPTPRVPEGANGPRPLPNPDTGFTLSMMRQLGAEASWSSIFFPQKRPCFP
jgi:hypothetical protein